MLSPKVGKTPSKLVLELGSKIEQTSVVKFHFSNRITTTSPAGPVEKWIPESKMARRKAIKLRTAAKHDGVIELQQFNPSFFLDEGNAISCRVPGCKKTSPRLKPSDDSQHIKQDLFLCEIHRTELANLVSKRCEKENIDVSVASFKHEDFHGYTHLIGELENVFMQSVNKPITLKILENSLLSKSNLVLAEVFLNARNFLTITHALLNPNGDNLIIVLYACFLLLNEIMNLDHQSVDLLERLVRALRDIMDIILNFYGIIYEWVRLDNPTGAQVGRSVGFVGGLAAASYFALSPVAAIATAVVALIAGNVIGNSAFLWYQQQHEIDRQNQRVRAYQEFISEQFGQAVPRVPLFHVPANAMGDLVLDVSYDILPEL